ncbi:Hypothetical protein CINCED_3A010333 [Cinara cedri]|uniref:Uncharacterized protein n=1 Tax=Cinara cedri TaxID=506608 RepID=A0A5E4MM20_9HEMI|nr:Hypothetical protein CINCED_3A010333 [Cinara cedri]
MDRETLSSSEWEEELETAAVFVVSDGQIKKPPDQSGEQLGEFHRLFRELRNEPKRFHMYFRMTKEEFDYLHELIKQDIQKQNTQFRNMMFANFFNEKFIHSKNF